VKRIQVAIDEHDLELFAHRVRVHFPKELQDPAQELALAIARLAGSKTKLLRPETTLQEILSWMGIAPPASNIVPAPNIVKVSDARDSLDAVEAVMALQEGFDSELPDNLFAKPAETTFLELVQHEADRRAGMRRW
jgi:acyl carrier protein